LLALTCSKLTNARFDILKGKLAAIREEYEKLQKNGEYSRSVTLATSDKAALQGRIHKVSALLRNFL
jgi:hypothetical protein